jgi:hypothetical protein
MNTNPQSTFKDWLVWASVAIGLFITLVTFIINLLKWVQDPLTLHIVSAVGFFMYFLASIRLIFSSNIRERWRWASGVVLYVLTGLFAVWVGTWIGAPSLLPIDNTAFSLEKASIGSMLYEGVDDSQVGQGTGRLIVTSGLLDGEFNTSYKLYYDLPKDGNAYAGAALWFPEPQDLSEYNNIELTLSFGDDQARFKLFIKDSFGGEGSVVLGDSKIVSARMEEQTISIPLKTYFPSVARKFVKEIDLDANADTGRGNHSFTVSGIKFRK